MRLRKGVLASRLTTVAVGGELSLLVEAETLFGLQSVLQLASQFGITVSPLGFGSNSIFPDEAYPGCVVMLTGEEFKNFDIGANGNVRVQSGFGLMRLARITAQAGFSGLEFAAGIPASLGGAVRMNAGAHGGDIGGVLQSVRCISPQGEIFDLSHSELKFHYRRCFLPEDAIILEARLHLVSGDALTIQSSLTKNLEYRKATQPLTLPSFGSVFRNPANDNRSAGELLERIGAKGEERGGAMFSDLHANWIVNTARNATAQDVKSLMKWGQERVQDAFGVVLIPEVVEWGSPHCGIESSNGRRR
ncbi:MAG: UDP-N-acetylmuramate dehydrogenase, partial [Bdellovibrionales bacterium]|nr:UDP-N-acetylmuramate dehydrogenase [Bdellovibrionales bacterium]